MGRDLVSAIPLEEDRTDNYEFDGNRSKPVEAERRMWMAVLAEAVWEIQSAKSMRKVDEAMKWFLSYDTGVGSFYWVCTILDLSPNYTRKQAYEEYCARRARGQRKPRLIQYPRTINLAIKIL